MARVITAKTLLSKHVRRKDRILLINPPVEETRYNWRRWNQPLELLKLSSWLRSQIKCSVELLDFMKPDVKGHVPEAWLPRDRRYYHIKGERYPMRRFGESYNLFTEWISPKRAEQPSQEPTQVWITSLCSYWYESVAEMCRTVRQVLPDVQIVLLGHYARLMPRHASEACPADFVISRTFDLSEQKSDLDLYKKTPPPFLALPLNPDTAVADIEAALKRQIYHFTFFEDDICREEGQPLIEIVERIKDPPARLRYHIICGLSPRQISPNLAQLFSNRNFAEIHFEEADSDNSLDLEAYRQAQAYLQEAGMRIPNSRLSGFVWIGRPEDQLEQLILRSFQVLDSLGNLILKPFTPTPGSSEHKKYNDHLGTILHREWSPHFFPFSEVNGISRQEYHDLYRMAAFLNEKVHNRSFDFLQRTLGAPMLRESLKREVWKLDAPSFRSAD